MSSNYEKNVKKEELQAQLFSKRKGKNFIVSGQKYSLNVLEVIKLIKF